MPEQQIDNPAGAFQPLTGPNTTGPPGKPAQTTKDVYNSGTTSISAGGWVALDTAGTSGHVYGVVKGLHGGNFGNVPGVAIDAIAAGAYGRIVTEGPVDAALAATGGVTAGNQVLPSATTDQSFTSIAYGSVTAGQIGAVIGIALQSTTTAGTTFAMWVRPS